MRSRFGAAMPAASAPVALMIRRRDSPAPTGLDLDIKSSLSRFSSLRLAEQDQRNHLSPLQQCRASDAVDVALPGGCFELRISKGSEQNMLKSNGTGRTECV